MRGLAVGAIVLVAAAAACGEESRSHPASDATASSRKEVAPIAIVEVRTPRLRVPRYATNGTYPQVRAGSVDVRHVNAALRAVVRADQHAYAAYARTEKPNVVYRQRGVYRTAVDRRFVSASTVVVSALLPVTRELFPGQHGGDGWLGITVRVPSGVRVRTADLFRNPEGGLRLLAAAWKARVRQTSGAPCVRLYPGNYSPTTENYRDFA